MARPTIAVVGGGVSGLAVTYHVKAGLGERAAEADVFCLEASGLPGGNIRTSREDGFTCEWGPNGFLDNRPATLELAGTLGIQDRLLRCNDAAAKRFIFRDGRLHLVPGGPLAMIGSGILSPLGKLRLLGEPLAASRRDEGDESVYEFASRRIGSEAAGVLVDAMVSGIFAGDVRKLSLKAVFPKMYRMERDHGSLFRAMLARRKKGSSGGPAGPGGILHSFRDGMQELTDALAAAVGPSLRLRARVSGVAHMGRRGFRLRMAEGAPLDAAVVVLACPAWHAAPLVESLDPEISGAMAAVPGAPLAVVHLGYAESDLGGAPDGFGFLVPRGQGPRILGCLWSSTIFAGRAEPGRVLLTCMIGGAHDREAVNLSDDELVTIARRDLETAMGRNPEPGFVRIYRHPRGIPQYTLGHPDRVSAIEGRLERYPGLLVAGNSYRGVSVNLCAEEAPSVARAALTALDRLPAARGGAGS